MDLFSLISGNNVNREMSEQFLLILVHVPSKACVLS